MQGSAKMVMETSNHPGELKDSVTSPSGSTIAGVFELEKAGLRFALINAVQTASKRAYEIGLIENYDTASEATYASRDHLAFQVATSDAQTHPFTLPSKPPAKQSKQKETKGRRVRSKNRVGN